jgi:hypothetical protein
MRVSKLLGRKAGFDTAAPRGERLKKRFGGNRRQ